MASGSHYAIFTEHPSSISHKEKGKEPNTLVATNYSAMYYTENHDDSSVRNQC